MKNYVSLNWLNSGRSLGCTAEKMKTDPLLFFLYSLLCQSSHYTWGLCEHVISPYLVSVLTPPSVVPDLGVYMRVCDDKRIEMFSWHGCVLLVGNQVSQELLWLAFLFHNDFQMVLGTNKNLGGVQQHSSLHEVFHHGLLRSCLIPRSKS